MKKTVKTDTAPRPKGPYSQGSIVNGPVLYIAGQGPVDPTTNQFVYGSFEEQARLTLRNLQAVAEAAGTSLQHAVKVNVYLRDMANFGQFNEIYPDYFPEPRPARTTAQSDLPGFEVEVDAIVAVEAEN